MSGSEPILVDARGMLCPWPALRLSRAAREAGEHTAERERTGPKEVPARQAGAIAGRGAGVKCEHGGVGREPVSSWSQPRLV